MKNINHLIRAGVLALLAIIGFTVVRNLMVPESFGKYGHYRADAVAEEMAKEPIYQGADACKTCHVARYKEWKSGKHHVLVNCEACHGPGKEHITKPVVKSGTKTIAIDRSNSLCIRCHLKLPARPHDFEEIPHPQIDVEKHIKGKLKCFKCHNPHYPDLKRPEVVVKEEKVVKRFEKKIVAPAKKEVSEPIKKEVEATLPKVAVSKIGQKIYEDTCLVCHGKTGDGKTEAAEFLDPKPPDFSAPSYKVSLSQLIELTSKGKGDQMPAYEDELSEEEIKEVAKYIQGFRK
jgi:mono/diheme cytochrome c family protein